MDIINSPQNKFVKEIMQIENKDSSKYIVEGKKFVYDLDENDIVYYAIAESFYNENSIYFKNINVNKIKIFSDIVFKKIADTKSNQGIIAVVNKQNNDIEVTMKSASDVILVLDNLQDPGNFGTIIRSYEAVGGNVIFTTKNTVSAYSSKCVRSTAGAINKVNIFEKLENELIKDVLKKYNYTIIGTHLSGEKSVYELDLTGKIAFIVGNEGAGMSEYFTNKSDILTKIPIVGSIESLNAAVATSVVLYESLRQKLL